MLIADADPPHGQPSPPCSSLLKTFQKLASKKQCTAHRGRNWCLPNFLRNHQHVRASSIYAACSRKRGAFGALVSFIEVPQSIEVPLRGTFHFFRAFRSSFLSFLNQHLSCTSGSAARCHLRPSLPREPQITTQTPFPGGALPKTSNGHR